MNIVALVIAVIATASVSFLSLRKDFKNPPGFDKFRDTGYGLDKLREQIKKPTVDYIRLVKLVKHDTNVEFSVKELQRIMGHWSEDFGSHKTWMKLCVASLIVGIASAVGAFLSTDLDFLPTLALTVSAGVLGSIFTQALFTDVKLHRVDRRILQVGALITLAVNAANFQNIDKVMAITSGVILLFCGLSYLFFSAIGASDIRSLSLVAVSAIPLLEYFDFMWAMIIMLTLGMLIGIVTSIKNRSLKVSIPIAPLILAPFWITLLLIPFIEFGPISR